MKFRWVLQSINRLIFAVGHCLWRSFRCLRRFVFAFWSCTVSRLDSSLYCGRFHKYSTCTDIAWTQSRDKSKVSFGLDFNPLSSAANLFFRQNLRQLAMILLGLGVMAAVNRFHVAWSENNYLQWTSPYNCSTDHCLVDAVSTALFLPSSLHITFNMRHIYHWV